jgi:catechol 1,2-dioxygenase
MTSAKSASWMLTLYEIPKSGPTGLVLSCLGRHFYRPAHLHLKLRHPQYVALTTQLYFDGGDYLLTDVANAVRDGLITKWVRRDHATELTARGLNSPFYEVHFDFVLVPRSAEGVRHTALT